MTYSNIISNYDIMTYVSIKYVQKFVTKLIRSCNTVKPLHLEVVPEETALCPYSSISTQASGT